MGRPASGLRRRGSCSRRTVPGRLAPGVRNVTARGLNVT